MPSHDRRPRRESRRRQPSSDARALALAQLAQHQPADDKEARDIRRIKSLILTHLDIFSRSCQVGHITASAAIIEPESRRTLLHFHKRLGRWLQVGGHLDGEADIARASLREAREETGLPDLRFRLAAASPAPTDIDIHTIPQSADHAKHLHLDFRYILITSRPDALAPGPGESTRLRWLSLADARALGDEIDPSLRRLLRKAHDLIADCVR